LGKGGVVQTNHNLDTQYTTNEMQTRQENKIKKENWSTQHDRLP